MEDIAKHVGIAKSNLYNYEHGDVLPKAGKMQALAAALDVSYEDLLAVAGVARPEDYHDHTISAGEVPRSAR